MTTTTNWRTAIRWQAELRQWWLSGQAAKSARYAQEWGERKGLPHAPHERERLEPAIAAWEQTFRDDACVWVSDDVIDLARQAVRTMPHDVTLYEDDLLTPSGTMVFASPLHVLKADTPDWLPLNTLVDGRLADEVVACSWHVDRERNVLWIADYMKREPGHGNLRSSMWLAKSLIPSTLGDHLPLGEPFSESDFTMGRTYVALLLLMAQKITRKDVRSVDRATGRQVVREGGVPSPVTIATLRRASGTTSTHEPGPEAVCVDCGAVRAQHPTDSCAVFVGREFSHRWVVAAHWRNQWYPRLGRHRRVLIASYVKGPEEKPVVLKSRAYKLVR